LRRHDAHAASCCSVRFRGRGNLPFHPQAQVIAQPLLPHSCCLVLAASFLLACDAEQLDHPHRCRCGRLCSQRVQRPRRQSRWRRIPGCRNRLLLQRLRTVQSQHFHTRRPRWYYTGVVMLNAVSAATITIAAVKTTTVAAIAFGLLPP
jgi:hypothetical protein